ncbi:unnamed protein product [Rotaria sp. Silwood2]|nr:unnamed protein product [Rotaria sp. Silwood2]CAF2996570.1 unnamed protein product [Rotaria sp. Silwood2]CAF3969384.1 unnamed protein product [Rotaria sp. Silwood2]CAF4077462.1 unnamed protein product [Rotaria sp. Silwood2]
MTKCENLRIGEEFLISQNWPVALHNTLFDRCYCAQCYPPTNPDTNLVGGYTYVIPREWTRFGIYVDEPFATHHNVWKTWANCYHGTSIENAKSIVEHRQLLLPCDTTLDAPSPLSTSLSNVQCPVSCSIHSHIPAVDLLTTSISSLARDLSNCRYSSTDLVRWYLTRIDAVNRRGSHPLYAIIETNPDALTIANTLDQQRQRTGLRSSLHGIPILVKDNVATHDKMQTTAGSLALIGARVIRDAHVVDQLRQAGAIILGKTSLSEWSNFRATNKSREGWSPRGGPVSSAYVTNGNPSGSSSGSAVAVSAGLCAAAVGTETAGSIVSPSSVANIVGLKPTVGLTSRSGVIPISHYHDSVGPMGRTVEDVALMLEVMQGVDSRDEATQQVGTTRHGNYSQFLRGVEGLRGLRLGIVTQGINMTKKLEDVVDKAIALMRLHGAIIIESVNFTSNNDSQMFDDLWSLFLITFPKDIANYLMELRNTTMRSLTDLIEFNLNNTDEEFHPLFAPNQYIFELSNNFTKSLSMNQSSLLNKTRLWGGQLSIDATLTKHNLDALVTPDVFSPLTIMASAAGYPLITVPLGYHQANGEPYGLMIAGTAWSEAMLLRVAHGFEQASRVRDQRRPIYAERD